MGVGGFTCLSGTYKVGVSGTDGVAGRKVRNIWLSCMTASSDLLHLGSAGACWRDSSHWISFQGEGCHCSESRVSWCEEFPSAVSGSLSPTVFTLRSALERQKLERNRGELRKLEAVLACSCRASSGVVRHITPEGAS